MITYRNFGDKRSCSLARLVAFGDFPWVERWVPNYENRMYHTLTFQPGPYAWNLLFRGHSLVVPLDVVDVDWAIGLSPRTYQSLDIEAGPVENHREYDGYADFIRYGSVIGGILSLLRKKTKTPNFGLSTDCRHTTYHGELKLFRDSSLVWPERLPRQDYSYSYDYVYSTPPGLASNRYFDLVAKYPQNPDDNYWRPATKGYPWNYLMKMSYIDDFVRNCNKAPIILHNDNNHEYRNTLVYSNFSNSISRYSGDGYILVDHTLSYNFRNMATSIKPIIGTSIIPYSDASYTVHRHFVTKLIFRDGPEFFYRNSGVDLYNFTFGVERDDFYDIEMTNHQTNVTVFDSYFDPELQTPIHSDRWDIPSPICVDRYPGSTSDITTPLQIFSGSSGNLDNGYAGLANDFASFCSSIFEDVSDMSAFSANDAFSKFHADFNALEFGRDFPDLIHTIKDSPELLNELRRISLRDVKGITSFADLLSARTLQYKYAIAPTSSDVGEIEEIVARFINGTTAVSTGLPKQLYGKFTFDIPDRFPLLGSDVHLTVRTKITLYSNPAQVILWILTADQAGFLPTLARLWDLRRLSFVIDWFTGLRDRLEFWDNTLLRCLVDVGFYEHTYMFETPIPSNYARKFSLIPNGASIRHFERYRSRFHPVWTKSRYDPTPPSGPDVIAGGSLLWLSK